MNTQPVVNNDLDNVLAELGFMDEGDNRDEILEAVESLDLESLEEAEVNKPEVVLTELEIEAAVRPLEAQETTVDTTEQPVVIKPEKKKGRKKSAEPKEPKPATEKKEKEKTPRKFYTSKVERISDKLGAELGSYTVLTLSDAQLTGDELAAKQKETLEIINKAGVKVQNRMTLLMEFVAGKSSKLNEVIERAFRILKKDGFIKSGEKGNLHADLMTKYSLASARAMGNNTIACLRDLSVIVKDASGNYVPNAESLIFHKTNDLLGL